MYGFDYGYEPANEGIGDFFSSVLEKIKAAGRKIKKWMDDVALKIRRMTGTTTAAEVKQDSKDAMKKIDDIGKNIADILIACNTQIQALYAAYSAVAKTDAKVSKSAFKKTPGYSVSAGKSGNSEFRTYKSASDEKEDFAYVTRTKDGKSTNYDITENMKRRGGMDMIDKDLSSDSKEMKSWEKSKEQIALRLAEQKGKAEKVSADLKSLSSYGPLGVNTTKVGYNKLREIFNANGEFGNGWKSVKVAAEWSTGAIKEALNKVVSMYDVGIRATDAFGARLARGYVRKDNGEKMDKEDLNEVKSTYKFANKVIKGNKSERDISVDRKSKNFGHYLTGHVGNADDMRASVKSQTRDLIQEENVGYVLDRLYQVAYEDAKADLEYTQEALDLYDSIPGAYEFVEESYDAYDEDFDYDYDPLHDMV